MEQEMPDWKAIPVYTPVTVQIIIRDQNGTVTDQATVSLTQHCAEHMIVTLAQHSFCRQAEDAKNN